MKQTTSQRTEIGLIPKDWSVATLGEKAKFRTGPFGSALHKSDYITGGIPIVNPMHIVDGNLSPSEEMTITEDAARRLSDFRLKPGEIIIGRRGDMGRCAVIRAEHDGWLCGTGSMIIRCGTGVLPEFIQRLLTTPRVVSAIEETSVGSTMINLNQGTLAGLKLQIPPEKEQQSIASALSDMDTLLAKLDQLIAKKRDIKQAAMQELLTGRRRLTGFSKAWTAGTLRDVIADLEAGVSVNSVDHENPGSTGQPCILKTSAIYDGEFNPDECKLIDTQDTDRARLSPRKDTILVSRMNTPNLVGEVGYVANDYPNLYLPDRLWMTRFHQGAKVCPRWLAYVLSSTHIKDKIKGLATGTSGSMKNISKGALLGLELAFPVLEEQIEIAMILSDIDTEITALEARREKTRLIKQGMMQELLSGRVRLN